MAYIYIHIYTYRILRLHEKLSELQLGPRARGRRGFAIAIITINNSYY